MHRSAFCILYARRGFTLIELLAVLIIVALLLGTFVPYALSIRETSNRARCTANLANIYRAMSDYAAGNNYLYPRVRYSAAMGNRWTAFTGADDANPFAADSKVSANDVTASLWLLVREGLASADWFVCPSGDASVDRMRDASGEQVVVKKRGNFRSPDNLGYGYATPYSTIPEYRLNDTLPARFALLADKAPRAEVFGDSAVRFDASQRALRAVNSPNHNGAGENVLYADGSVGFETSPYCGVGRTRQNLDGGKWIDRTDGDNIYTALAATPLVDTQPHHNEPGLVDPDVGPAYRYDTLLVPGDGFTVGATPRVTTAPTSTSKPAATLPATAPVTTHVATPAAAPATVPASLPSTSPTSAPSTQP